jgi:hypothetical protein
LSQKFGSGRVMRSAHRPPSAERKKAKSRFPIAQECDNFDPRRGGWWRREPSIFCTESTAMIILGIILSVFAIGFFCWLLFTLAVYALPFYIGLMAAFAAFHHGYGLFGSGLIAIIVAASVLALGQFLFAAVRVPLLRACIALVFAIPAAVAGYQATFGIAHICIPAGPLSQILAFIGGTLVGGTAWSRMGVFIPPATGEVMRDGSVPSQLSFPANG